VSCRWAIFISGQGSNMSALLDLRYECSIDLVVSSRADSYGLLRARRNGLATFVLPSAPLWSDVAKELKDKGITHIFLAGFMKIIPAEFLKAWDRTILNVHPSLLPKYPGLKSIRRAFDNKDEIGVTVHQVTADVDAGAIVLQRKVCESQDVSRFDFNEIEKRVHIAEYELVRQSMKVASCWI
jgi:phosphoribosylglycinamide formyltransferase 1